MDVESDPAYKKRVASVGPVRADPSGAPVIFVDPHTLTRRPTVPHERRVVVWQTLHLVPNVGLTTDDTVLVVGTFHRWRAGCAVRRSGCGGPSRLRRQHGWI